MPCTPYWAPHTASPPTPVTAAPPGRQGSVGSDTGVPCPQAVCCADGQHCCPQGTACDLEHSTCISTRPPLSARGEDPPGGRPPPVPAPGWGDMPALSCLLVSPARDVRCDDEASCPDGTTCCRLSSGAWGCCPLEEVGGTRVGGSPVPLGTGRCPLSPGWEEGRCPLSPRRVRKGSHPP